MQNFYVEFINEKEIEPFMKNLGVEINTPYKVLGTIHDKLLIQIERRLLEVYPKKVRVVV